MYKSGVPLVSGCSGGNEGENKEPVSKGGSASEALTTPNRPEDLVKYKLTWLSMSYQIRPVEGQIVNLEER